MLPLGTVTTKHSAFHQHASSKNASTPFSHTVQAVNPKLVGITSFLISGGCDKEGKVPILPYQEQLKALSKRYKLNAHVGLVTEKDIKPFQDIFSAVSFDFVSSDRVIKEVYHLNKTLKDYLASYRAIQKYLPIFPHITLGLYKGQLTSPSHNKNLSLSHAGKHIQGWEYQTVDILVQQLQATTIVLNIFIPTQETKFASCKPPSLRQLEKYFSYVRTTYPGIKLVLGCMRPRGSYRTSTDQLAVKYQFQSIVLPTKPAQNVAKNMGYTIQESYECCVW